MTLVLDTHVLQWWSAEQHRLSSRARDLLESDEDLAVSAITWYELAWLAQHGRIITRLPVRTWMELLAAHVRTIAITPGIADTAALLPETFPRDPADRLIYATAVEAGCQLVTKDGQLLAYQDPRRIAIW